MLKQGLELKQTQKLSPLQIQTIKLIELPIQELEQRIRKEIEENPVLDEEQPAESEVEEAPREVSLSDYKEDDSIPSYRLRADNYNVKDERPQYSTFSVKESFSQSLMEQLGYRNLTEHQYSVGAFIIGSLDDDGYLRRSIDSVVDDIILHANIDTNEEEVLSLLKVIQEFEPAGVGARDLRECLLLQIKHLRRSPAVEHAEKILKNHFSEFTAKHFQKIMSRMSLSEEEMKAAIGKILKLNPSPGGQIDDSYSEVQQIVPDFILEYTDGQLHLSMPRFSIPELKVNRKYADILMEAANSSEREKKEAATFVKKKLDSAKWFVEAIKQRHNTLSSTMQAILDYQHDYFIDGDEASLKPMVLKDIAEKTGFDISTISRVVNSKYIETHFGIYSLKYFFSEGMETKDGEEVSTRELKKALQECVDNEDKHKPLTDDELVEKMSDKGYKVARRTIAKYRDQLGIPKARLRKEL